MPQLKTLQQWFGSLIARPITSDDHILPVTPAGNPVVEEAKEYIRPSNTLVPHERIEIYNQQYWWRLFGVLHQIFPLVTRIFGYRDFNKTIATPYLCKYPPMSWSLNSIGHLLPRWIEEEYSESDKNFVADCARIDLAFADSFLAPQKPLPALQDNLLEIALQLQPHVILFALDYHLPAFRDQMVKEEGNYWTEHDFPKLRNEKRFFFILYRNLQNNVLWEEVSEEEYALLQLFTKKTAIQKAISKELPPGIEEKIEEIFLKWGARGLLGKCDEI